MNKKGFTLIELLLVIIILGILAVSALPNFFDMSAKSRQMTLKGELAAVKSGIVTSRANDLVMNGAPGKWPQTLDDSAIGPCKDCFKFIMAAPIDDSSWQKTSDTTYSFNDGNQVKTFTYDPTKGIFE